jgi:hypothetical protein
MQEKYYLEVDECPQYNWRKANEGRRKFLRKNISVGTEKEDNEAFDLLFRNFVEVIGLSEEFAEYLKNLEKLNKINLKFIQTNDRFLLNEREYLIMDIKAFEDTVSQDKTSTSEILMAISREQGYQIKEKDITVLDYHNLIKNYGKKNNPV